MRHHDCFLVSSGPEYLLISGPRLHDLWLMTCLLQWYIDIHHKVCIQISSVMLVCLRFLGKEMVNAVPSARCWIRSPSPSYAQNHPAQCRHHSTRPVLCCKPWDLVAVYNRLPFLSDGTCQSLFEFQMLSLRSSVPKPSRHRGELACGTIERRAKHRLSPQLS